MSITNSRYDAIMQEYDAIRFRNLREYEERLQRLEARYPELARIRGDLKEVYASLVLKRIRKEPTDELLKKQVFLEAEEARLMKEYGLTEKDFSLHYDCEDCKDTAYINGRKCKCFYKKIAESEIRKNGVYDRISRENISNYDLEFFSSDVPKGRKTSPREDAEKRYNLLLKLREDSSPVLQNMLLTGSTGVGKTFFMNCIAGILMEHGIPVLYMRAEDLFRQMSEEMRDRRNSGSLIESPMEYFTKIDVLMIDDLGSEFRNSFTDTKLFYIIDKRIEQNLPTIISTNLDLNGLKEQYTDRTVSRFMESYRIYNIFGTDIRVKKFLQA